MDTTSHYICQLPSPKIAVSMSAYEAHLRKIHNNEVFYNGPKPHVKPFTTERDIIDSQHKFLRDDSAPEEDDSLAKTYYDSLIKDCVLVDLSRYKESKVSLLRWESVTVGGDALESAGRSKGGKGRAGVC